MNKATERLKKETDRQTLEEAIETLRGLPRNPEPITFEIFYEDLNDEAQRQLLETFGAHPDQFNDMPIAMAYWAKGD